MRSSNLSSLSPLFLAGKANISLWTLDSAPHLCLGHGQTSICQSYFHVLCSSLLAPLLHLKLQTSYVIIVLALSLHHQIILKINLHSLLIHLSIHYFHFCPQPFTDKGLLPSPITFLQGITFLMALRLLSVPPTIDIMPSFIPFATCLFHAPLYYWELFGCPICFPSNMVQGFDFGFYGK